MCGIYILTAEQMEYFKAYVQYTKAHCESLMDEVASMEALLEGGNDAIKKISSTLD